jgi:hypothetical protein
LKMVAEGSSSSLYLTSRGHIPETSNLQEVLGFTIAPVHLVYLIGCQLNFFFWAEEPAHCMTFFVRKESRKEHTYRIGFEPTTSVFLVSPDRIYKLSRFILLQITFVIYKSSLDDSQ